MWRRGVGVAAALLVLGGGGSAFGFGALPSSGQVNDDPTAGISPTLSVSGEDPTNADLAVGALTAGAPGVPWALFRQGEAGGAKDQIFARSFAGGAWTTRGAGTVGGRSSAAPAFSGSLNFDQGTDGEAPSIDFAGTGRTVPWATWYESTSGAGPNNENVFASRFDNSGDANQGKWIFAGQDRGLLGGSVPVPSLNLHTGQAAENPSVAGGSAVDPTKPSPWVAWQETTTAPVNGKKQVFVSRAEGPGQANCDGVTPAGVTVGTDVPAIGGFCWQQVGVPRVGPGAADPSLDVDPTRDGVEPDIAFTGTSDSVPWVVWYEQGTSTLGLDGSNELVFAAKAVSDGVAANGGFHWVAVGSQLQGTLDTSGATNHFGTCAESTANEAQCSLNSNPAADAEDVRVAAGTMTPGSPTVPWAAWDETVGGVKQVFVSRLVGSGAGAHFQLANNLAPISTGANDSTRPDITFSGNTPYVTWREDVGGGVEQAFVGHLTNAANPIFVLDESDVPLTPHTQADVREPISSACTATPFNQDGSACQGAAVGTPVFLFTNGTSPFGLFADAYQPDAPVTAPATAVTTSSAVANASVNPHGASVNVFFQYGASAAYGQTTAAQASGPGDTSTPLSASLTGLPAGGVVHFRAVAVSDFGTFVGADQTLTTASTAVVAPISPPITPSSPGLPLPQPLPSRPAATAGTASAARASVSGSAATARVACRGASGAVCAITLALHVRETLRGGRVVAVAARKARTTHRSVVIGSATARLTAGQTVPLHVGLNATGRALLARHPALATRLTISETVAGGRTVALLGQTVTFHRARPRRRSG